MYKTILQNSREPGSFIHHHDPAPEQGVLLVTRRNIIWTYVTRTCNAPERQDAENDFTNIYTEKPINHHSQESHHV